MGGVEYFTQACEIAAISLGVTVLQKELIVTVRRENGATVLNRAPVVLRTRTYLPYVAKHTGGVAAVQAVGLLDRVQVGELMTVNRKVRPTRHACDAIYRKTYRLIQTDPKVEQEKRDAERVNDRRGQ
jgi:hypothetical protein